MVDGKADNNAPRLARLSVLTELQCELIVANTMDGLASARARGRVGGRRPKLTAHQAAPAQELYARGTRPFSRLTLTALWRSLATRHRT
ncbi:hypothetical protein [Streptosporangium sp. NPDC004631]